MPIIREFEVVIRMKYDLEWGGGLMKFSLLSYYQSYQILLYNFYIYIFFWLRQSLSRSVLLTGLIVPHALLNFRVSVITKKILS